MVGGTVRERGVIQVNRDERGHGYGFPLCATSAGLRATPAHIGRCLRRPRLPGRWSPEPTGCWRLAMDTHLERLRRACRRLHFRGARLPRLYPTRGTSRLTSLLRSSAAGRLDQHEQEAPLEAPARVR